MKNDLLLIYRYTILLRSCLVADFVIYQFLNLVEEEEEEEEEEEKREIMEIYYSWHLSSHNLSLNTCCCLVPNLVHLFWSSILLVTLRF